MQKTGLLIGLLCCIFGGIQVQAATAQVMEVFDSQTGSYTVLPISEELSTLDG